MDNSSSPLKPINASAVIFDLDGTLLNSIDDIADCANTALSELGLPTHTVEEYMRYVGDGFANLARKILPSTHHSAEAIQSYITRYRELYLTMWNHKTKAYPGIESMLHALMQQDLRLAVLSNKRDDFTKRCVDWYFPNIRFVEIRGERTGTPIKPDPTGALEIAKSLSVPPGECLFVGDSEIDMETARQAGMHGVGVLWGFRPRTVLELSGPTLLIANPAELVEFVRSISSLRHT
jgi:phosphoglycolate phosphatase